jgi:hypothetical protein
MTGTPFRPPLAMGHSKYAFFFSEWSCSRANDTRKRLLIMTTI